MKKFLLSLFSASVLALGMLSAGIADAQTRPYRGGTDRQVNNLVTSIESKTAAFKTIVSRNGGRSGGYNGNRTTNDVGLYISDFESATAQVRSRLNSRQTVDNSDIEKLLNRANIIDSTLRNNRSNTSAQSQWDSIKTDLNSLAKYYNVSWNWTDVGGGNDRGPNGGYGQGPRGSDLTGTYRLNVSQSDNVQQSIDRALTNTTSGNRDRFRSNLERRLQSPDVLVIDRSGRDVTIGSSASPQITITADGVARSEQTQNGRTFNTTATLAGDGLTINYVGDRSNDFFVSFTPAFNGQLKVTRRIYLENQNSQVTVSSVYDRTNRTADWTSVNTGSYNGGSTGSYNGNNNSGNNGNNSGGYNNGGYNGPDRDRDFYIPNGTSINAILSTPLSTKTSVDGDRFRMDVRTPSQYQGAVIEGHVSSQQSSGRVSGRAQLSLVFDRITLRNGQTYRFSGIIDNVRSSNGETINVNNEGVVRDNNQTTKTVTRAGIGAGIGAIIGAIAGGGQGAAIGAVIGGGAGAGSVVLQGRDNLELASGTEINLTSTAPSDMRARN